MSAYCLYSLAFLLAFAASLVYTPVVRKIAVKNNFIASPKEDRWHKRPTALLGGVGIFSAFITVWLGISIYPGFGKASADLWFLIMGSAAMFVLGLIDDIFDIKPQHKLIGQIVIASCLVFLGFQIEWFVSKTANLMVSIFWIIGITNAFNLLDNMDGLSAGIAFLAGAFLLLAHIMLSPIGGNFMPFPALLSVLLGSILGFLIYNFNPASIFMGDSGSLYLGFTLAGLAMGKSGILKEVGSSSLIMLISIPILILFIPIADTTFVSLMRRFFRRPISQGGQDHLSHRIVAIGFSERSAVLILYGFALISGLLAMSMAFLHFSISAALISVFLVFTFLFWNHLAKVKVYDEESIIANSRFTPLLINITYKKRLFEIVLDLVLIPLAYWIAYILRFEGAAYAANFSTFIKSLPIIVAAQILSSYIVGAYRGIWQFVSMRDCILYIKAATLGTCMAVLGILILYRFAAFSRTVFIIYWMLVILFTMGSRFSYRLISELTSRSTTADGRPAIIYGAGSGGQLVLKEIEQNKGLGLRMLGFLDDDIRKHNGRLLGYPVFGGIESLGAIQSRYGIADIIISFRNMDKSAEDDLKKKCKLLNISLNHLKISIQ